MSLRSLTSDQSVKEQKLKKGTVARIFSYAKPYKTSIIFFLITVVIDAVLVVTTPLILKKLIDEGVIPGDSNLVTKMAILVGFIAIADAIFSLIGRWFSS
ncbi:MAG: hypothetical protein ACKN8W_04800, partial [Actinomycetales bacterium]